MELVLSLINLTFLIFLIIKDIIIKLRSILIINLVDKFSNLILNNFRIFSSINAAKVKRKIN
jgi:hypothetical protein